MINDYTNLHRIGLTATDRKNAYSIPRFGIIGIGDMGEAINDFCISKGLYGIDYLYINNDNLLRPNNCEYDDKYHSDYRLDVNSTTDNLEIIKQNLPKFTVNKKFLFLAFNINCKESLSIAETIINGLNQSDILTVALTEIHSVNKFEESYTNRLIKFFDTFDVIYDHVDYDEDLNDNGLEFTYYLTNTPRFADYIKTLSQLVHGTSFFYQDVDDIYKSLKAVRYHRHLVLPFRKNDIEIYDDVVGCIDYLYSEIDNHMVNIADTVFLSLELPDDRNFLVALDQLTKSLEHAFPYLRHQLLIDFSEKPNTIVDMCLIVGEKTLSSKELINRTGTHALIKERYIHKRRKMHDEQMSFISHISDMSSNDKLKTLQTVYIKISSLFPGDDYLLEALNHYSECYRFDIAVNELILKDFKDGRYFTR